MNLILCLKIKVVILIIQMEFDFGKVVRAMRVRLQRAKIKNFRNVENGEIRFACNFNDNIFASGSDILGIYGQNGSGKTAFICVLRLLKSLISGSTISEQMLDDINKNKKQGFLEFEFSVEAPEGQYRLVYSAQISKDRLSEEIKVYQFEGNEWNRLRRVMQQDSSDMTNLVLPKSSIEKFIPAAVINDMKVVKILCAKERRSFLFSSEMLNLIRKNTNVASVPWIAVNEFAKFNLFVVTGVTSGLIFTETVMPIHFKMADAQGNIALPMNEHKVIPMTVYNTIIRVIDAINTVLCKIVPGMQIKLADLGNELQEDGELWKRVQLVRPIVYEDGEELNLPLKFESEGIKKIISILHLYIAAYNNDSITVAIDELDSGIFEYLLAELLSIMQDRGKGQLIFTSHDLCPLERLPSKSIIFTTTNPKNRYTRMTIKSTNNLRNCYIREVALGGGTNDPLYEETNRIEIAHVLRKVGRLTRNGGDS